MSEMVQRVAMAICIARRWSPENWDLAEPEARAAIAAMREPTVAMSMVDTDPEGSTWMWHKMIDEALK